MKLWGALEPTWEQPNQQGHVLRRINDRVSQAAPKKLHLDQVIGTSQGFGQRSFGGEQDKRFWHIWTIFWDWSLLWEQVLSLLQLVPLLCVVLVKAVQQLCVKEELTQDIWEVMRCISKLNATLELFHHGKSCAAGHPWRNAAIHLLQQKFLSSNFCFFSLLRLFLTTKQSWENHLRSHSPLPLATTLGSWLSPKPSHACFAVEVCRCGMDEYLGTDLSLF